MVDIPHYIELHKQLYISSSEDEYDTDIDEREARYFEGFDDFDGFGDPRDIY